MRSLLRRSLRSTLTTSTTRLHPSDPVRCRPRDDQTAEERTHSGPDDPVRDLRPADRDGLCPRPDLLLGRKSRGGVPPQVSGARSKMVIPAPWTWRSTATPGWRPGMQPAPPGSPFGVLRGYAGSDLLAHTSVARIACPFTGEELPAVPALKPDVTVIHAQQADRKGKRRNVGHHRRPARGGPGRQVVDRTVEEIVDELEHDRSQSRRLADVDGDCSCAGAGRLAPLVLDGLHNEGQRVLYRVGRHLPRPGHLRGVDEGVRGRHCPTMPPIWSRSRATPMVETGPDQVTFTPDEMMTVTAARGLSNGQARFVGIGLPSEAANLARSSHAPDVVLIYESGNHRDPSGDPPPLHRRRRAGREGRPRGQCPRDLQLLASGREDRRRVPLGCPDRPIRKPEQHRHRLIRPPRCEGCPAPVVLPRLPLPPGKSS